MDRETSSFSRSSSKPTWWEDTTHAALGGRLCPDEIQHLTDTARRFAALLLVTANGPKASPQ